jgi:NADP-dependent 3-hydroxy acid dehydrogenase YdfG
VLVTDKAKIEDGVARGIGLRSEDIPEAVAFMLTRPQCVTIRDLVILARNQEI